MERQLRVEEPKSLVLLLLGRSDWFTAVGETKLESLVLACEKAKIPRRRKTKIKNSCFIIWLF